MLKRERTEELSADDKVILLLGETGVGKSTLINAVGEGQRACVNNTLVSCTSKIEMFRVTGLGRPTVLVDTPGFGSKEDIEIFTDIISWLTDSNIKLAGIVCLLRITDNRITNTYLSTFRTIGCMVGEDMVANVVVVTTMWDDSKGTNELYSMREDELRKLYLKVNTFMRLGKNHANDFAASARGIVDEVLRQPPFSLLEVQREMKEKGISFSQTKTRKSIRKEGDSKGTRGLIARLKGYFRAMTRS